MGNQATYKIDKINTIKGMRVEFTLTFSVIGTCAPLFVTMPGLNEHNLHSKKNLLLQGKELRVGDGGVNIDDSAYRYLFSMVTYENADLLRYAHYQKKTLLPFIAGR